MGGAVGIRNAVFQEHAYPDKPYPVVDNGSQCVLCEQGLDHAAIHRLKQFESLVASTVERELRQLWEAFAGQRKAFAELKTTTEAVDETLKELRIDHEALADAISAALRSNEKRHAAVLAALEDDKDLPEDCAALVPVSALADVLARQLDDRIKGAGVCADAVQTDHHEY